MVTRHFRRTLPAALAVGALSLSTMAATAATSHGSPGVRLLSPDHSVVMTIHNSGPDEWVEFNAAAYLESPFHQFEVDVRRRNAHSPITAVVRIGDRTRRLHTSALRGWAGLKNAFTLTWMRTSGQLISRTRSDWCPNDGTESRLSPSSATTTNFIYGCTTNPFTRGERWGIDRGWSRQLLQFGITPPSGNLPDHLILEMSLRKGLAQAFGIRPGHRTLRFRVTVQHVTDPVFPGGPGPVPGASARVGAASSSQRQAAPASSVSGRLNRGLFPDLIALPAWQIATHNENGRDLLDFAATVYNGGPGPLVAEGFRRGSTPVMTAYQFFYNGTKQVASRRVGTMRYDARPTHMHWHFKDFARYDLVDSHQHALRTSGKEAFCLAPTDAIDLLQPGAVVNPGDGNLATACGDVTSIWVREVLASGWGDTYSQQRAGQSIDITGLPNGTYWIRVTANPAKRLYETTRRNNVSLRRVILGGTPGHRTVRVPKYGRINSEAGFGGSHPPVD